MFWLGSLRLESLPSPEDDSGDVKTKGSGLEFWGFWNLVGQLKQEEL